LRHTQVFVRAFLWGHPAGRRARPGPGPSVPSDASGRAGKDPGGKRSMTPAPALTRGGAACRKSDTLQGEPISACCAGQKFLPPGIPLGTKLSAEPRTRRKAARTLSALNFPVCVPSIRTCRLDGTFLTVCPAPHPGRGFCWNVQNLMQCLYKFIIDKT